MIPITRTHECRACNLGVFSSNCDCISYEDIKEQMKCEVCGDIYHSPVIPLSFPGDNVFHFGKHQGRTFEDVRCNAVGYIAWAKKLNKINILQLAEFVLYCSEMEYANM
jgi:hypothetical protein